MIRVCDVRNYDFLIYPKGNHVDKIYFGIKEYQQQCKKEELINEPVLHY